MVFHLNIHTVVLNSKNFYIQPIRLSWILKHDNDLGLNYMSLPIAVFENYIAREWSEMSQVKSLQVIKMR